jgi:hypothetical protein
MEVLHGDMAIIWGTEHGDLCEMVGTVEFVSTIIIWHFYSKSCKR